MPVGGTSLPYPVRGIAARISAMAARGNTPGSTPLGAGTSTIHPTISVDVKTARAAQVSHIVDSVVHGKQRHSSDNLLSRGLVGDKQGVMLGGHPGLMQGQMHHAQHPGYEMTGSGDYSNASGFLNTMAMVPGTNEGMYSQDPHGHGVYGNSSGMQLIDQEGPPPSVSQYLTNGGDAYHMNSSPNTPGNPSGDGGENSMSKDMLYGDAPTPSGHNSLMVSSSPLSTTTSLLSDPLPSITQLEQDSMQRPTSLPPFGYQNAPTPSGQWNDLNSYTAMF